METPARRQSLAALSNNLIDSQFPFARDAYQTLAPLLEPGKLRFLATGARKRGPAWSAHVQGVELAADAPLRLA